MKRYIERNFNGNLNGNLYELEHHDDFISARIPFIGAESLSKFADKADLKLADDQIAAHGLAGANQMMDLDQFIKIYAMEFLLKHWDGYSDNTNNTYLYNDVTRRRVTRPGQRQVQADPLGDRPDPATAALLQDEHQRTDREARPQRRRAPRAADQPDPDVPRHDLRPRDPAGHSSNR